MTAGWRPTRRSLLHAGAVLAGGLSLPAAATAIPGGGPGHGFSPLGSVKYPPGFAHFDYVNPGAPKGGTLRLARIGTFDTVDTLVYPGRPPADVRLIYERLTVPSADETASHYGLLAQEIAVAEDFSELVYTLDPAARWHDGRPVTADDIVFTFETLKANGAPFYRQAFRVLTVEALGSDRVRFRNGRVGDREIVDTIATIPIHPGHVWQGGRPQRPSDLVGSGPYRVREAEATRRLVLERVPDAWAADHPVNTGRWNFDRLRFEYYRDADVALEAFLGDSYDLRTEGSPLRWARRYDSAAVETGAIRRAEVSPATTGTLHGIVFNLRRPVLADLRVRRALCLAYDFETVNRTLYFDGFQRFDSVFAGTDLAADGPPTAAEQAILKGGVVGDDGALPFDPDPFADGPQPGTRAGLVAASRLLDEVGLVVRDGVRIDPTTGTALTFGLVSPDPVYDGVLNWLGQAWQRLGVTVRREVSEPTAAGRRLLDKDFDLATLSWTPDRLPGTAERLLWHGDLVDMPRSYALSGIADPQLDWAIEALESARTKTALTGASRAFDRLFRHRMPMLPLFRANTVRLAWWDRFGLPDRETGAIAPSPIDRWWAA